MAKRTTKAGKPETGSQAEAGKASTPQEGATNAPSTDKTAQGQEASPQVAPAQAGAGPAAPAGNTPASDQSPAAARSGAAASAPGPVVEVVGPKRGRRRAGRDFGATPVLIPAPELSEDELQALRDDPALAVVIHEPPASKE